MERHAYPWGFSGGYQNGLGPNGMEEVESPTRIVNTATEGVRMVFTDAGASAKRISSHSEHSECIPAASCAS